VTLRRHLRQAATIRIHARRAATNYASEQAPCCSCSSLKVALSDAGSRDRDSYPYSGQALGSVRRSGGFSPKLGMPANDFGAVGLRSPHCVGRCPPRLSASGEGSRNRAAARARFFARTRIVSLRKIPEVPDIAKRSPKR
jgi:hypothetical protein